MVLRHHLFETAHGVAAIVWREAVVVGLRLPAETAREAERGVERRWPASAAAPPPPDVERTMAAVRRYFRGETVDFTEVAIDLGEQEPFAAAVYGHVRALRWGEATSYGAVASALGAGSERARDVGATMAANPVPLIVPCHRVLAAGGKVGGFSAPGGAVAKARMLALEGIATARPAPDRQGTLAL